MIVLLPSVGSGGGATDAGLLGRSGGGGSRSPAQLPAPRPGPIRAAAGEGAPPGGLLARRLRGAQGIGRARLARCLGRLVARRRDRGRPARPSWSGAGRLQRLAVPLACPRLGLRRDGGGRAGPRGRGRRRRRRGPARPLRGGPRRCRGPRGRDQGRCALRRLERGRDRHLGGRGLCGALRPRAPSSDRRAATGLDRARGFGPPLGLDCRRGSPTAGAGPRRPAPWPGAGRMARGARVVDPRGRPPPRAAGRAGPRPSRWPGPVPPRRRRRTGLRAPRGRAARGPCRRRGAPPRSPRPRCARPRGSAGSRPRLPGRGRRPPPRGRSGTGWRPGPGEPGRGPSRPVVSATSDRARFISSHGRRKASKDAPRVSARPSLSSTSRTSARSTASPPVGWEANASSSGGSPGLAETSAAQLAEVPTSITTAARSCPVPEREARAAATTSETIPARSRGRPRGPRGGAPSAGPRRGPSARRGAPPWGGSRPVARPRRGRTAGAPPRLPRGGGGRRRGRAGFNFRGPDHRTRPPPSLARRRDRPGPRPSRRLMSRAVASGWARSPRSAARPRAVSFPGEAGEGRDFSRAVHDY